MTKLGFLHLVFCFVFINNITAQNLIVDDPISSLTRNETNKIEYLKLLDLKSDIQEDNQQLVNEIMDLKSLTKSSNLLEKTVGDVRKYEFENSIKVLSNKLFKEYNISEHRLSEHYINLDSFLYFSNSLNR